MKIVRHNSLPASNSFDWSILLHFCTTLTVWHSSFMDNEQVMGAINALCNGFITQGKIDLRSTWRSIMYRFQFRRKVGFGSRINFSSTSFASISDRGSTIYELVETQKLRRFRWKSTFNPYTPIKDPSGELSCAWARMSYSRVAISQ